MQVQALYSEGQEYSAVTLMLMIVLNEECVYRSRINEPNEWRRDRAAGDCFTVTLVN